MTKRTPNFYKNHSKHARKYPFVSLAEAENWRKTVKPHFTNHVIRETIVEDDRGLRVQAIGLWRPGEGGFHIFGDDELASLGRYRINARKAKELLLGAVESIVRA